MLDSTRLQRTMVSLLRWRFGTRAWMLPQRPGFTSSSMMEPRDSGKAKLTLVSLMAAPQKGGDWVRPRSLYLGRTRKRQGRGLYVCVGVGGGRTKLLSR